MYALIIEDSKLYQRLLNELFTGLGYSCFVCNDAESAKQIINQHSVDIVCTNMHLQDSSGIEFSMWYRERENTFHAPIFLLTSELDEKLQSNALESGVTEVFQKNDIQRLYDEVESFIKDHENNKHNLAGRKILYIEDSTAIAQVTMAMFTEMELETTHFTNAEAAIDSLNENTFDLVVTDIVLEGEMTGLGLVKHIRDLNDERRQWPILAMTGHDDASRRLELYRAGINDYVTKPVIEEELNARVHNLISAKLLMDKVHEQQEELRTLALTDKLTGCHNRHALVEFSPKLISDANRHSQALSMMVIDLDHFKAINDTHGHATGDVVLTAVGQLLVSQIRDGDFVARFGGEEFVIILSHCDEENARKKSEQLREKLEAMKPAGLTVTASIGLAVCNSSDRTDFDELFAMADHAVYEAKDTGRNRVCVEVVNSEAAEVKAS